MQQRRSGTPAGQRRALPRGAQHALTVVMCLAAIGYTASVMRPIYAGDAPVVGDLIKSVTPPTPPVAAPLEPSALADSVARIEASSDFADQKQRFAADLVRTGRMS